jgi:hypothetical protein
VVRQDAGYRVGVAQARQRDGGGGGGEEGLGAETRVPLWKRRQRRMPLNLVMAGQVGVEQCRLPC